MELKIYFRNGPYIKYKSILKLKNNDNIMKQLAIYAAMLLASFMFVNKSQAQQIHVTSKAKKAFAAKFPNAKNIHWGKESPHVFEAEFTLNGTRMSANFDEQGHWKETETPISKREVPNAVMKAMQNNYGKAKLRQAYKVAQPGRIVYEMEIKMGGQNQELVFSSKGAVIHNGGENEENGEKGENDEGSEGGGY